MKALLERLARLGTQPVAIQSAGRRTNLGQDLSLYSLACNKDCARSIVAEALGVYLT